MKRISIKSYISALAGGNSCKQNFSGECYQLTSFVCLLSLLSCTSQNYKKRKNNVDYWFFDPFFQQQLALNSGDVLTASETSALNTSRTNNPAFSVWRS